jgi:transposase-like protein
MTAADLVDKLLASEHPDVLRDSVAWLVAEVMEAELGELTGAGLGERAPERRQAQRNTYRPRRLALCAVPAEHWPELCPTNPLERVNREVGRRTCRGLDGPGRHHRPCSSVRQDRPQEVAQLTAS